MAETSQPFSPLLRSGADKTVNPISLWKDRQEPIESVIRTLVALGFHPDHLVTLLESRENHPDSHFAQQTEGFTVTFAYCGKPFIKVDAAFLGRPVESKDDEDLPISLIHGLLMQGFNVRAVVRIMNSRQKAVPPIYTGYMLGQVAIVNCRGERLYCNWIPFEEAPVGA
jgi:hypothetical protein